MEPQVKNKKAIKNSEIRIGDLPLEFYMESQNPELEKLYCLFIDSEILKTPNGAVITHPERSPLRELMAELEFLGFLDSQEVSLYSLCCNQIDVIQNKVFNISEDWLRNELLKDPMLNKLSDPKFMGQYQSIIGHFFSNLGFPSYGEFLKPFNDATILNGTGYDTSNNVEVQRAEESFNHFVHRMNELCRSFNSYQLNILYSSVKEFDSLLLATLLSGRFAPPRQIVMIYMLQNGYSAEQLRNIKNDLFNSKISAAECMFRYMDFFPPKLSEIERIIQRGETKQVEFKSTFRLNIKAGCNDPAIEYAALKTIVAFLNSDGGTLLVGIEDNGNILGIEPDGFKNEDKYLLYFSEKFNSRIGKQYAGLVSWDLKPCKMKKVLHVKCQRSVTPVFLKNDKQEEFYIRTGPSSVKLTTYNEIDEYRRTREMN